MKRNFQYSLAEDFTVGYADSALPIECLKIGAFPHCRERPSPGNG